MSEQNTLYRCYAYKKDECGTCPDGEPHGWDILCATTYCSIENANVSCIEYDRDPCNDPTCPDCTSGDGVSCKGGD